MFVAVFTAMLTGADPVLKVAATRFVAPLICETVFALVETKIMFVAGFTAIATGVAPSGTIVTNDPLAPSNTPTLVVPAYATYTRWVCAFTVIATGFEPPDTSTVC